ncbi:MAG: phytanoyl-CoA dioxygenase family protein [Pseudonocardiaceae bacterium]|nr:phytanoyl-CoA dioxygenase family protein [Pseudonocardiaceae bacterium]
MDGAVVLHAAFTPTEVTRLRMGVEAAVERITRCARSEPEPVATSQSSQGHRLQTVHGTSIHWEPDTSRPTVRNLRPVTHLDARLTQLWDEPRLTRPAADLLGVPEVGPLTSKISFKRAGVGSEFIWHQDYTFLQRFLGTAAREAVTAMVLLDDADADNGALTLVPGSHLAGPRPDGEPPNAADAPPVTIEAAAGSVLLFPTLMLHSSGPNRSERDRRALLLLYQPAGRPNLDETHSRVAETGGGDQVTSTAGFGSGE